ncbi:MAG: putative prolin-rich exported protein [Ramlibacter sp.]|nr:putative prolin-rich exported protein [Ramlibacter sp.]
MTACEKFTALAKSQTGTTSFTHGWLARRLPQAFNKDMSARHFITGGLGCRRWTHSFAALALAWGGNALAQDVVSVPAAHLHHAEGSVAYAPQGDKEWHDVQPRRLLKRGDRLWTDRGSRAEVQAGGHALRLNGETQLVLENVGETATQLSLTQGSMVATVTRMNPGDSFEVGTPNLAFRARQMGDYRIDVDTKQGVTRVVVLSGLAVVYGEQGEAMEVRSGQRVTFRERRLARVQQPLFAATDDFDRWAGARRRGEPTVSMPIVAQGVAPAPALPRGLVNKGPDIIIKGSAAEVAAQTGIPAHSAPRLAAATATAAAPAVATATASTPAVMVTRQPAAAAPVAVLTAPVASAKPIPTAATATPLKVTASSAPAGPSAAEIQAQAQAQIAQAQAALQAQAAAHAQAHAAAQAQAREQAAQAHEQERQRRLAQQRAEEDRRALVARAEQARRAASAAEARRIEEHRRAVAARRAEEDRRHLQAKREADQKHAAASVRADEERRHAQQARRAAEERHLEALRKADVQKLAELRRQQLARLQAQAGRDEQSAVLRRAELARRADDERREEQARREDQGRREEQARREDDLRRQRALAEQVRRDQARRDEEVWLRQQQNSQPVRPVPMGVPFRRVS